jgi:N-acetylmuramoyl-L-alanine amidase
MSTHSSPFATLRLCVIILLILGISGALETPSVIIIDPGHGGSKVAGSLKTRSNSSPNNVTTAGGLMEKDLTLEFSKTLKERVLREACSQGKRVGVLLTREDDRNLDFVQRATIANRPDTACVVSIHFNSGGGKSATGSLALIAAEKRNSSFELDSRFGKALAAACNRGVRQYLPDAKSRGVITDGHLHGGLGSNFFFQMLRHKRLREVPKCFPEVEFIDNPKVERALLQDDRTGKFRVIAKEVSRELLGWAG